MRSPIPWGGRLPECGAPSRASRPPSGGSLRTGARYRRVEVGLMVEVASAEFQSAVGVVKCALLSQHIPAAGGVRVVLGLAGLRLWATDLERWCEICVGEAPGEGAQEVGVQAKRLMGLAAVLPSGRAALEISKAGPLLVRAGPSRFTLPPIGLDDVPVSRPEVLGAVVADSRSEEHTSELQSQPNLLCRLLL